MSHPLTLLRRDARPRPPTTLDVDRSLWEGIERVLAGAGIVLIGAKVDLPYLLTAGAILAALTLPLWLSSLRHFVGAGTLMVVGVLAMVSGAALSWFSADDHELRFSLFRDSTFLFAGFLASFGFLLWARERLSEIWLVVLFGVGLLLGTPVDSALFSSNPWKFGFSNGATVLLLGLALVWRRRGVELAVAVGLLAAAMATDARSQFAVLLLTVALLVWQLRPQAPGRRASAVRFLLGFGLVGVVAYAAVQALILRGFLGAQTQMRSQAQIDTAGSLILGGRPELAATLALFRHHPWGFGSATHPNLADVQAAKDGMVQLNYDPNNGYVENQMFGSGYSLHSVVGDLWALFGWVGLLFAALVTGLVLWRLGKTVGVSLASGVLLYLALRWLWNVPFSPWYSSVQLLLILLALALFRRTADPTITVSDPSPPPTDRSVR